jgi:hypothetical protein
MNAAISLREVDRVTQGTIAVKIDVVYAHPATDGYQALLQPAASATCPDRASFPAAARHFGRKMCCPTGFSGLHGAARLLLACLP